MTSERTSEEVSPASILDRVSATLDRVSKQMEEDRALAARENARQREQEARQHEQEARQREQEAQQRKQAAREMAQLREQTARQREQAARQHEQAAREMAQLRASMQETDRRLKKAEGLFTTQWGRLMESLVEGDLVALLKQRNIAVERTLREGAGQRNGESYEVDILAVNGREVVVVEVKTTLRSEGVTRFLGKLARFLNWSPEYRNHTIYGAVAYLRSSRSVIKYAERQGLFVIRATGDSASIVNAADFVPRAFGAPTSTAN